MNKKKISTSDTVLEDLLAKVLVDFQKAQSKLNRLAKRPKNEQTSPAVLKLAAKALKDPTSLTSKQIQKLAGSAMAQAPDKD